MFAVEFPVSVVIVVFSPEKLTIEPVSTIIFAGAASYNNMF